VPRGGGGGGAAPPRGAHWRPPGGAPRLPRLAEPTVSHLVAASKLPPAQRPSQPGPPLSPLSSAHPSCCRAPRLTAPPLSAALHIPPAPAAAVRAGGRPRGAAACGRAGGLRPQTPSAQRRPGGWVKWRSNGGQAAAKRGRRGGATQSQRGARALRGSAAPSPLAQVLPPLLSKRLCLQPPLPAPAPGKRIDLSVSASAYARAFKGSASPVDAPELLQLVHALFSCRWARQGGGLQRNESKAQAALDPAKGSAPSCQPPSCTPFASP
jgi:hypothetical protein